VIKRHFSAPVAFVDTSVLVAVGGINNPLHEITKASLSGYRLWYTPTVRREFGNRKGGPPEMCNRYPPRTGTVVDRLEDDDDLMLAKVELPASTSVLEAAITSQCRAREESPLPADAVLSRRVLTIAAMEEAFKEIWEGQKHKDLTDDQKSGFRHDLYIVFEASYHMYDIEVGWALGDGPSPVFVTNNLKFYKRFIGDPKAKEQLRHIIGKHGFEHLIEVTTVAGLVGRKVIAAEGSSGA